MEFQNKASQFHSNVSNPEKVSWFRVWKALTQSEKVKMVKAEDTSEGSDPVMNALVHQYLLGVDKKLGNSFKKAVKADLPDLDKDMPSLPEMVASYQVRINCPF